MRPEQTWRALMGELQLQMTQPTYDTWLRDVNFISLEDGIYTLSVPSEYVKEWLETKLLSTIKRALKGITGSPAEFNFIVDEKAGENGAESDTPADSETLEIKTHYGELHNALIQPNKPAWMTRYFWIRWGPILGNNRAAVVIALREHYP